MSILAKLLGSQAPFEQLVTHLRVVMKCVDLIKPILTAATTGDRETFKKLAEQTFQLEHEADEIKNKIRDHLPKAVLLPVSRSDLLAYLKNQDSLADKVEDLVLSLSNLRFPNGWSEVGILDDLFELADRAIDAAKHASGMLGRFEELRKKGFAGDIVSELRLTAGEVGKLEWKVDKQQFKLVQKVLDIDEPSWHFASSYVLLHVISALGKLADNAESMGDHMRLMIAD